MWQLDLAPLGFEFEDFWWLTLVLILTNFFQVLGWRLNHHSVTVNTWVNVYTQLSSHHLRPPGVKAKEFEYPAYSGMEFIRVMQVGAEARGWNCTCLHVTLRIDVVIVVTYINYRFISAFQPCFQVFLGSSSDLCTLQQWRGRPGSSIYVNNVNPWNPSSV